MGKLIIKGDAKVFKNNDGTEDYDDGSYNVEISGRDLAALDGVEDGECFSEYFDEDEEGLGATGGYLRFEYDPKERKLFAVTEYDTERHLSDEEAQIIADYTSGQWSDGVGEGFEQSPVSRGGNEYYLSAWHRDQVLQIIQED